MPTTNDIYQLVDLLEQKTASLKSAYQKLQAENVRLEQALEASKSEYSALNWQLAEWKEKYQMLKVANSVLGSNEHKTDSKLKINALIRDIDACIAYLSE
ncbi:MAG: hypothetical protein Q4G08_06405 [Capnocytophaga sp.]|nr:hypothetical protein [Capnocytophaga sp.]